MTQATVWRNLENMPSERSRSQKTTWCVSAFIKNLQNRQTFRKKVDAGFPGAGRRRGMRSELMGTRFLYGK